LAGLVACHAEAPRVQEISAEELLSSPPTDAVLLDVRSAREFASGHVPHAVNISHDELAERLSEVGASKSDPVIVYCESGKRAGMAANVLLDAGYTDVWHLSGDMAQWREAGRPTVQETAHP
jgi:rhodanese-related sulfurtransferase